MNRDELSSRLSGFYKRTIDERIDAVCERTALDHDLRAHLERGGGLALEVADRMSENVVAIHGLPLSVALNFRVNARDYIVPMSVEEPSVVAAASNAARMVRESGAGFTGDADASIMCAQVQFDAVPDVAAARRAIDRSRAQLLALGDSAVARMVARGGGCRDLELRVLDAVDGTVVVHVYVDVGDAMGANLVDTVAEAMAPALHECVGGSQGLRILTNLPMRRLVRARAEVRADVLGGEHVADAIVRASRFAELDPYRAVTHNKGFMNGLDAVAVALGQDWRSIEAAAHAYASFRTGVYRPISVWKRSAEGLVGTCELPLAVGTVGGSTRAHDGVRAAFRMIHVESARELAVVMASVGLASNLAALRALATEGIQRGHMQLHRRKQEAEAASAARRSEPPPAAGDDGPTVRRPVVLR